MAAATRELSSEIRKLRKKLRQIENLERSARQLSEEEEIKVARKFDIRETLLELLAEQGEETASTFNEGDLTAESSPPSPSVRVLESSHHLQTDSAPAETNDNNSAVPPGETAVRQSAGPSRLCEPSETVSGRHENAESKQCKQPQDRKEAKKDKVASSLGESERRLWRSSQFSVDLLEGHSDLITAVDTDGQTIVSASRDTTVKVWSVESCEETRNLGGHTNSVTCVQLLSASLSSKLCDGLEEPCPGDQYVVSGSLDCSLRLWSLHTGQTVKRVYTFDPVTRLQFTAEPYTIFTGSDGGKIAMWDLSSGEAIDSVCAHQGAVSALQVCGQYLYTASEDGVIKIHQVRERSLSCMFVSESLHRADSRPVTLRCVRDLAVIDDRIVFGDDRENLKILSWRTGTLTKLQNNLSEFGSSDAVCCHGDLLLSSGYDLDNGLGFINVRSSDVKADYLSTLADDDTGRILDIACHHGNQGPGKGLVIVSGGEELKLWRRVCGSSESEGALQTRFLPRFSRAAIDSDDESDSEVTDSDDDSRDGNSQRNRQKRLSLGGLRDASSKGWLGWCSVL